MVVWGVAVRGFGIEAIDGASVGAGVVVELVVEAGAGV